MKPAPFTYHRPGSLGEAVALLSTHGSDAKILAGGQSLIPLMNFRLAQPAHLIDINEISALTVERDEPGMLALGALTRHQRLTEPDFQSRCPLLSRVGPLIGHPQIRTRGTLGGSAAHADSTAELPGALVALDADIVAVSERGERVIAARDFFVHYLTTALADDELVTMVRIPRHDGEEGCGFTEVAARRGDFALAGAMVRLLSTGGSPVSDARVVLIGAGPTPLRVTQAEQALIEHGVTTGSLREVEMIAREHASPWARPGASVDYLKRLAGVLAKRSALAAAAQLNGNDNDN